MRQFYVGFFCMNMIRSGGYRSLKDLTTNYNLVQWECLFPFIQISVYENFSKRSTTSKLQHQSTLFFWKSYLMQWMTDRWRLLVSTNTLFFSFFQIYFFNRNWPKFIFSFFFCLLFLLAVSLSLKEIIELHLQWHTRKNFKLNIITEDWLKSNSNWVGSMWRH